jgi:fermentation-respiration switch protein FrsA (DUF1100 family)
MLLGLAPERISVTSLRHPGIAMTKPRRLACSLSILLAVTLSGCVTARISEQSLLRPSPGEALTSADVASVAPRYVLEQHTVVASDGTRLSATLLRLPGAVRTVLYFGGNAYRSGRFGARTAAVFEPLGVNVMILDKRGYGASEGFPTVANIQTDGAEAFDYLVDVVRMNPTGIIVHGQSVGSVVAAYVAANRVTAGVVLESAVTTTEDWMALQTRSVPFVRARLDESLRGQGVEPFIGRIEEPVLLLVGAGDETTPPQFSRALLDAASGTARRELVVVPGAGHNDVLRQPLAVSAYRTFLADLQ